MKTITACLVGWAILSQIKQKMKEKGICKNCGKKVYDSSKGKRYVEIDGKLYCIDCRIKKVTELISK